LRLARIADPLPGKARPKATVFMTATIEQETWRQRGRNADDRAGKQSDLNYGDTGSDGGSG
jgi:hypothetical protein